MEFKVFYKNHPQHQWGDQVLEEMTRKNKVMRAKSRHEMRQAFRNMTNESEEENDEPQQHRQEDTTTKQSENSGNKPVSEEEQYCRRLQRLLQFREQKRRMQQEKKIKAKAPFVPFVPKKLVEATQEPLVEGNARPKKPLSELLDQAMQTVAIGSKTPAPVVKCIKPRVDCWRTEKLTPKVTENVPPKNLPSEKLKPNPTKSAVKVLKPELKRAKETQQPVQQKPIKTIRHAVTAQTVRPLSQQKKPAFVLKKVKPPPHDGKQTGGGGTSAMVTSTVRKHRKPLAFTFEPESEIKKDKGLLNVIKTAELFDGISPIEVESPWVRIPASNGVRHSSPVSLRAEGDSIWDPQPVACLSTYDATAVHDTVKLSDSAVLDTKGKNEQQIDGNISDWVPAVVHEIDNDTIVIDDDDDEVLKEAEMSDASAFDKLEDRNRKPALNESFTISVDTAPSNGRPAIIFHEPTVPPLLHMVTNNGSNATSLNSLSVIEINSSHSIEQDRSSSSLPKEKGLNGSKAKKRISWTFTEKPLNSEIEQTAQPTEQGCSLPEQTELDGSKTKKRASLIFTEEPLENEIVPSRANLSLDEKIQQCSVDGADAVESTAANNISLRRVRRSSVRLSDPSLDEQIDDLASPKEVREKTRFYYEKIDNEGGRLQGLCDLYAPFLEPEHELNDHCRGLIIAAQGQTNILFKKKFTKFRELIGHYELKWNDRKVRHDDLDGFW
uniref:Uncharacterized protein n=1 Tax=Anopheles melas TaxID=34690 RepID=A0A182UC27_9DIPT